MQPPRGHVDRHHRRAQAHALAQLGRHALGHAGRALGHAQRLPVALVVEAAAAGRRLLAQLGEERGALDRVDRERAVLVLDPAQRPRAGIARAQPVPHAERVEPRGVRVAPGVVRVDRARERLELGVQPREVLVVGRVHPGRAVAHRHALVGAPGIRQVERCVARLEREPQLGHQAGVGALPLGGQLAAELDRPAVVEPLLLHPAAGALTRLQHQHVGAAGREVARTGEPGQPRPHHHDVPF